VIDAPTRLLRLKDGPKQARSDMLSKFFSLPKACSQA